MQKHSVCPTELMMKFAKESSALDGCADQVGIPIFWRKINFFHVRMSLSTLVLQMTPGTSDFIF